jgi:hypothetical protein
MRRTGNHLQAAPLHQRRRLPARNIERHDAIGIAVHDEQRHVHLREIVTEVERMIAA